LKKILFVSFLDFKEKSIQVIRKTPEAYRDAGWDVRYLVARDNSVHDNYIYEQQINPSGIEIFRYILPWNKLINRVRIRPLVRIINKIRYLLYVNKYAGIIKNMYKEAPFDILYGYEYHGFLACKLAKRNKNLRNVKLVSRFQGTFFYEYFKTGKYAKILANLDHLCALRMKSDLCIMTNDGTQGDKALDLIKSGNRENMLFLVNGVNNFPYPVNSAQSIKDEIRILTVSRIVGWKRLDRVVSICAKLLQAGFSRFSVTMIGDGPEKENIEKSIIEKGLTDHIKMIGAVPHSEINENLRDAHAFLSFYDSSNVGNPLLEAIRANKIIFTLNNGDTGEWIFHKKNGFIYEPQVGFEEEVCRDLMELVKNPDLVRTIQKGIKETEVDKLWTWKERFEFETESVGKLVSDD